MHGLCTPGVGQQASGQIWTTVHCHCATDSSPSALPQSNDRYQSVLPMQVVQHAKVRFSQHDVAWRECDKARWVLCVWEGGKREGGREGERERSERRRCLVIEHLLL